MVLAAAGLVMVCPDYPFRARLVQRYSAGLRVKRSAVSSPGRGWEFFSSPRRPDGL
jgi:hypothetical protein